MSAKQTHGHASAAALIVAAGSGTRLGARRPKAFVELAGRTLLDWSVAAIEAAPSIGSIVIALPAGERAPLGTIGVAGGVVRSASVRNALEAAGDAELVLVHDAARPLLTPELIERVLSVLTTSDVDAAIAAAPVVDTIKREVGSGVADAADATGAAGALDAGAARGPASAGRLADQGTPAVERGDRPERTVLAGAARTTGAPRLVAETVRRDGLWAVQTPQAFRRGALERALAVSDDVLAEATDDAWLIERGGGSVALVASDAENLKITTPLDLELAALLLRRRAELIERAGAPS